MTRPLAAWGGDLLLIAFANEVVTATNTSQSGPERDLDYVPNTARKMKSSRRRLRKQPTRLSLKQREKKDLGAQDERPSHSDCTRAVRAADISFAVRTTDWEVLWSADHTVAISKQRKIASNHTCGSPGARHGLVELTALLRHARQRVSSLRRSRPVPSSGRSPARLNVLHFARLSDHLSCF